MRLLTLLAAALGLGISLAAQDQKPATPPKQDAPYTTKAELYPMATCLVTGEKLGDDAKTFVVEGRTFKTCCGKCQGKVEKAPAEHLKKLDEAALAAQLGHYPLDVCAVSGEKLGSMGDPVKLMLDGTLVQLCCKSCVKKANASPGAMAQKVRDAAYKAQLATYPLDTCAVSGEKLGADAKSIMFGTTLVRFCCNDCAKKFEQDPSPYVLKLHPAAKKPGDKKDAPKDGKGEDQGKGKSEGGKDGR